MAGKILSINLLKKIVLAVALTGFWAGLSVQGIAAKEAPKNQPSDKVVSRLMTMTWQMLPEKTSAEDEKGAIVIDKSKPKEVLIPTKDARRIIQRAYLTGKAQACDLRDLQIANYRDMMNAYITCIQNLLISSLRQVIFYIKHALQIKIVLGKGSFL